MGKVRRAAIGKFLPDLVPARPASFLLAKVARGNLPEEGRALARRRLAGIVLGGLRTQQLQRAGKAARSAVLVQLLDVAQPFQAANEIIGLVHIGVVVGRFPVQALVQGQVQREQRGRIRVLESLDLLDKIGCQMLLADHIQESLVGVHTARDELARAEFAAVDRAESHRPAIFHQDLRHRFTFDHVRAGLDDHLVQRVRHLVRAAFGHLRLSRRTRWPPPRSSPIPGSPFRIPGSRTGT